jgi:putative transposase
MSVLVRERAWLRRLQRTLARAKRGSNRRGRVKHGIARLKARETDRRKDWAEKTSTGIARRFDVMRVEDLQITKMTRSAKGTRENPGRNVRAKAGLNRGILASGWGLLVRACHADVNAAINIAAGHAVTARGGDGITRPVNREPHLLLQSA